MYTSDIDMTRKKYAKKSVVYLFISLFCILFGAVYELYSHEVYSYHMIYAFVFPLVGGTLLFSILGLIKIRICSGTFARNFYHSGVATLTVGSIVQGILDIYGTTNMLTCWYWRIGLLFIILSIVLTLIYICSRIKSPDSVLDKLKRTGYEQSSEAALHHLYDTVGIRAVCAFAEDVYCLAKWLHDRGEIKIIEERDYYAHPKPNGYRSYHILLEMADGAEKGYRAEIQIRTIANDFWAALEHRLKYKKDIPYEKVIQDELKRCAFEISSVDASMQAIRDLLKKDELK